MGTEQAITGGTVSGWSTPPRRRSTRLGLAPFLLSQPPIQLAGFVTEISSPLSAMTSSWPRMPACAAGAPSDTEITVGRAQVRLSASAAKERKCFGRLRGVAAKRPICGETRSLQKLRLATRRRKATLSTRCSAVLLLRFCAFCSRRCSVATALASRSGRRETGAHADSATRQRSAVNARGTKPSPSGRSLRRRHNLRKHKLCYGPAITARYGPLTQRHLSLFAQIGAAAGRGGHGHAQIARNLAAPIPILGANRRDRQKANVRIVRRLPPRFRGDREQLLDARAIVRDHAASGHRYVFLIAVVGEGERQLRIFDDLVVGVPARGGEKADRVALAVQIGRHRPDAQLLSVPSAHHADGELRHQVPDALRVFGHDCRPDCCSRD